jgi:hypothetical protein
MPATVITFAGDPSHPFGTPSADCHVAAATRTDILLINHQDSALSDDLVYQRTQYSTVHIRYSGFCLLFCSGRALYLPYEELPQEYHSLQNRQYQLRKLSDMAILYNEIRCPEDLFVVDYSGSRHPQ